MTRVFSGAAPTAIAGAAGLWLGFPNAFVHAPLLALLYPAALCLLGLRARNRSAALRQGWLAGLAGASAALYWLALPVHDVAGLPWPLAVPCAMAVGAYVGLYGGLYALCAHALRRRPPLAAGLALGILWYLLEFLRGSLFTGFPWLTLAAAFAPWPFMIQAAEVCGAYALGGILAAAACLAVMPMAAHAPGARRAAPLAGILLLVCVAGFGLWRMTPLQPLAPGKDGAFGVVMAEGNIDQNQKWDPVWQQSTVSLYENLSRAGLARYRERYPLAPPPLLVWPETAMPFYLRTHPVFGPRVRDFARRENAPLLAGAPGVVENSRNSFLLFNRAYLVKPDGTIEGWYDKMHLVPFGEYLPPLLAFDFLKPLLQGVGDFTPGRTAAPLRVNDNLALGLLICYESIFPELSRRRVADGANVLVNISNDGWFGDSAAPEQHLQLAVLRAVEQRRWLVRGTNTGISAIVDDKGRLRLRGAQFRPQSLEGVALPLEARSVFYYVEPWLPYAALLTLIPLLLTARTRRGTYEYSLTSASPTPDGARSPGRLHREAASARINTITT